jgi:Predicted membrane protein (DUF2306)
MTSIALTPHKPSKFLSRAALFWLGVVAVGQWLFFFYIFRFYGISTLQGNFEVWAKHKGLINGYIASDPSGNAAFGVHAVLASVVALCGVLQLIPYIRTRAPSFHRWNGRVFLLAILTATLSGFALVWWRGTYLNIVSAIAVSLNGVLIIAFGALAWRAVRAHNFAAHQRWALRTFIVAFGVWFQRLGYFAWFMVMQGPVGVGEKMDGAFDIFIGFACYLLPLAVLELYLRAKESSSAKLRTFAASVICFFTSLMVVGIVAQAVLAWLPLLKKL